MGRSCVERRWTAWDIAASSRWPRRHNPRSVRSHAPYLVRVLIDAVGGFLLHTEAVSHLHAPRSQSSVHLLYIHTLIHCRNLSSSTP